MIAANLTPIIKFASVSELCVSVFSSPNIFPSKFEPLALSLVEGSAFNCLPPKSFAIRTSAKTARNPFRMNTSKTKDFKLFRMNTYEKTGEGGSPYPADARIAVVSSFL